MGEIEVEEMDDTTEFLGGMTEREYFKRLNFQRSKFDDVDGGHK